MEWDTKAERAAQSRLLGDVAQKCQMTPARGRTKDPKVIHVNVTLIVTVLVLYWRCLARLRPI